MSAQDPSASLRAGARLALSLSKGLALSLSKGLALSLSKGPEDDERNTRRHGDWYLPRAHRAYRRLRRRPVRTGVLILGPGADQNLEPAEDQPPAVERHRIDVRLNTRIGHHLFHALVACLFGRPHDPGEHNCFVVLLPDGHRERRKLSIRDVVAPAFDQFQGPVIPENRCGLFGMLSIGVTIRSWHRRHKSIDVGHGRWSPRSCSLDRRHCPAQAAAARYGLR